MHCVYSLGPTNLLNAFPSSLIVTLHAQAQYKESQDALKKTLPYNTTHSQKLYRVPSLKFNPNIFAKKRFSVNQWTNHASTVFCHLVLYFNFHTNATAVITRKLEKHISKVSLNLQKTTSFPIKRQDRNLQHVLTQLYEQQSAECLPKE